MATGDAGTWAEATITTKGITTAATMETISPKVAAVGEVTENLRASTTENPLGSTVDATKTCRLTTLELSIITIVIEMTTICHMVVADKVEASVLSAVIIITMTRDLAQ